MESEPALPKPTPSARHKCCACFKQYKKKEHLVEHMQAAFHSVHEPSCDVCEKHCKSFESLREHLSGPLAKAKCSTVFAERGCHLCLKLFDGPASLSNHKETCYLSAPISWGTVAKSDGSCPNGGSSKGTVALDCEMVGGKIDGTMNICARVCLVDEDENILFHAYVQPRHPVTDYRHEVTGLTEELLRNAAPLEEVQDRVLEILYDGESVERVQLYGGKARLLVGHSLMHDMDCLNIFYPDHLLRDTANYRPLMKTNLVSHSLKYLTRTYLGYDIQISEHDPYEDCVSAMRLYKRMRAQEHQENAERFIASNNYQNITEELGSLPTMALENMTSDELYHMSTSNYKCWCLDRANL